MGRNYKEIQMSVHKKAVGIFSLAGLMCVSVFAAGTLDISPSEFDFGWAPDNAKISAEFTVKNPSLDLIPLIAVQPTCGCTATDFQPSTLKSSDETKVHLTFNTRGYTNAEFHKNAQVKTGSAGDYTVKMTGHVTNPAALFFPVGDGVASFEKGGEKKKTIQLQNKSTEDLTLFVVQPAAEWAKTKLDADVIKAGTSGTLEISVSGGDLDKDQNTSITIDAKGVTNVYRATVAIRSGTPPAPYRKPTSGEAKPKSAPEPKKKSAPAKK
jgi:hypothetical protein